MRSSSAAVFLLLAVVRCAYAEFDFELCYDLGVQYGPWNAVCIDTGDLNNDGLPDCVVIYSYESQADFYLHVFLGLGDCTFDCLTNSSFDHPLGSLAVDDLDQDGFDDILVGDGYADLCGGSPSSGDFVHVLEGNGDGTFTEAGALEANNIWVASGDLDDDGNVDVVISNQYELGDDSVSVALGSGDFTFQDIVGYEVPQILHTVQVLGDMNLDGNVDLGYLTPGFDVYFLYGNGDGTFQDATSVAWFTCGPNWCFIEPGDFDEDSIADFVATCGGIVADYDVIFTCDGGSPWPYSSTDSLTSAGTWPAVADFDLDGHQDVALTLSWGPAYVYPGYGDGTFGAPYQLTSDYSWAILSQDFDLDGDQDLVVCEGPHSGQHHVRCYRNLAIVQGCEEDPVPQGELRLTASLNPFSGGVAISVGGHPLPDELLIIDASGRSIRTLSSPEGSTFLWDGRDASGNEVPPGTYFIQGASAGRLASVRVVKL